MKKLIFHFQPFRWGIFLLCKKVQKTQSQTINIGLEWIILTLQFLFLEILQQFLTDKCQSAYECPSFGLVAVIGSVSSDSHIADLVVQRLQAHQDYVFRFYVSVRDSHSLKVHVSLHHLPEKMQEFLTRETHFVFATFFYKVF